MDTSYRALAKEDTKFSKRHLKEKPEKLPLYKFHKEQAFITIKDYKPNIQNNP